MNFELHKLPEGFIVTSDEKINKGDIAFETLNKVLFTVLEENDYSNSSFKKVIAQQDQIDFSGLSEEEQKEIGYFNLNKFKIRQWNKYEPITNNISTENGFKDGLEIGFLKAQELLSDRVFTEENILIIRNKLVNDLPTGDVSTWDFIQAISNYTRWFDDYIQSLSQPKSWSITGNWENNKFKITQIIG